MSEQDQEQVKQNAELLENLLENDDLAAVKKTLEGWHPADIAEAARDLPASEIWRAVALLPVERQAVIFGYLSLETQVELAHTLKRTQLADILTEMSADDRTDLYNKLTDEEQKTLMPALSQAEREDIRRLASHPEGSTGAIMTSDYALLSPELTAYDAIKKLRMEAPDKETIYRSFVVDENRRLMGTVRLKDLIIAAPETRVREIMDAGTLFLNVDEPREEAARKIAKYDMIALPVLDHEHRLIGIITHDDAMDVAQEEATEDFHKMAAHGKLIANVREASIALLYRYRVTWLLLLVFVNIFTGEGIAYFEDTIAAYLVLVFFLPLLIDSGGNAGSQSATLMIRAMATGDVHMRDWSKLVGREFFVALAIGVTMAVAVSLIGFYRGGMEIAMVVALSMCAVVMVGSLIGMSLPFLLSKLKLDPAVASAPLVTSLADVSGVLIYFTIATALLDIPS